MAYFNNSLIIKVAIAREMANHPLYRKAFNEGDRTVIIEPSKWRLGELQETAQRALNGDITGEKKGDRVE